MERRLLIMRHAKSAWGTEASSDSDRPLNERGLADAPRMGRWLGEQGLVPQCVVSSPAQRARETALGVCEGLGIGEETIRWADSIYEANVDELCDVLASCPAEASPVLLVGHNPGVELLVRYLCRTVPRSSDGKLMPTAAVAHLQMPLAWDDLAAGAANLVGITRPRSLQGP